jgi:hypothetical protein
MLFLRSFRCQDCYRRFYSLAFFEKRLKRGIAGTGRAG